MALMLLFIVFAVAAGLFVGMAITDACWDCGWAIDEDKKYFQ